MPDAISSMSDSFWRTAAAIKSAEETEKKTAKDNEKSAQLEVLYKLIADPTSNDSTREYAGQQVAQLTGLKPDHLLKSAVATQAQSQQPQQPQPHSTLSPMPKVSVDPSQPDALQQATVQPENVGRAPVDTVAAQQTIDPVPIMESPMPQGQMGPGEPTPIPKNPYNNIAGASEIPDTTDEEDYLQEFALVAAQALEPQGQYLSPVPTVEEFPQKLFKSTQQQFEDKANSAGMTARSEAQARTEVELDTDRRKQQQAMQDMDNMITSTESILGRALSEPERLTFIESATKARGLSDALNGEWKDLGGQWVLVDKRTGQQKAALDKSASPEAQLQHLDREATLGVARQRLAMDAQKAKAETGATVLSPDRLKVLNKSAETLGMDTKAFKDIAGKDYQSYMAYQASIPGGKLLIKGDIDLLRSGDNALAGIQEQANTVLRRNGIDASIDEYAIQEGIDLNIAEDQVNKLVPSLKGLQNLQQKNNAFMKYVAKSVGLDPEGYAIDANVAALAPAIAKALGHVGNLNISEVQAAIDVIPSLTNTPREAAALYLIIKSQIDARKRMVYNRARFDNDMMNAGEPANEQGLSDSELDALINE